MLATTKPEGTTTQATAKCDFCDLHLKTDLDISRHLSSDSHRNKLAQFLSLQNLNTKSIQKEVPKNIVEVLKALRLRTDRDARELADKTFFKIYDDTIAEIALELNKSFFKSVVEFETRSLAPGVRTAFINALEPEEGLASESNSRQSASTKFVSQKTDPKPPKELPRQSPTVSKTPQNSEKPPVQTTRTKVGPLESSNQQQQQQRVSPLLNSSSEPQPVRKPGQIPRIQRQEQPSKPQHQTQTNPSKPQRPTQQPTSRPQPKPTHQERPVPSQSAPSQPPPAVSSQAVSKNGSTANEGNPVPRPNSTYVPRIAVVPRIKIEPKDD